VNIGIHIELASLLRLSLYTWNTAVKNRKICPVWTLLQAAEITEMFGAGGSRICSVHMVQASTCK
jgi:hypothetical protein